MVKKISIKVDNENIAGLFHDRQNDPERDSEVCIISCHGLLANKDSIKYITLAEQLSKTGYPSIRFDFRGCGESDGRLIDSHITNRIKDLNAVVEHASNDLGFKKFGLFGSSMGGFVSFLKASSDHHIKALVSLASPYSMTELFDARGMTDDHYEVDGVSFGNEYISDVKKKGKLSDKILQNIKCPVLVFHGTMDWLVPTDHAQRIFDRLGTEKMLKIIEDGDHIFSNPYHLNGIIKLSVDWFKKYLPWE